jgi:pimeloyl-ACP methyl ester carboxylesterase
MVDSGDAASVCVEHDAVMNTTTLRDRMLADAPVIHRTIDVGGVATSLLEAGSGDPLVLLHGGIESGGIMWTPVLAELARTHRVVVPDVPGLGESAPVSRLDVATFTDWFERLLELTHLDRPTVVAHSLIGSMAARCVARRGDMCGRLVVYAAPGVGPYRMPWRLRYVAIRFAIRPTERNAERLDRFALLDLDATRGRDPGWWAAFEGYTRERATRRHVKRAMNQLIAAQTKPIDDDELRRIAVPTSLVWGRLVRLVQLSIGENAALRHHWPLHEIDGAAHAPHVEQPERFAETLATVLGTP